MIPIDHELLGRVMAQLHYPAPVREPWYARIMTALKRFLSTKPGFIRLINAVFAVGVAFNAIDITEVQFGVIVLAIEATFAYISQLAGVQTKAQFQAELSELS